MVRVVVVGCGGIGSRHIQGAAKCPEVSRIDCVEISEDNISLSKSRLKEIEHDKQVNFYRQITDLTGNVDVCIIATPSGVRKKVLLDVLEQTTVRCFILEKIVFQEEEDFELIIETLASRGIKCWVNCYSRAEERYKYIKNNIAGDEILKIEAAYPNPPNFNLASSVIHSIDLFCYLRDNYQLDLDLSGLEDMLISSKHAGYSEFRGTIRANNNLGDSLVVRPAPVDGLTYTIRSKGVEYVCSESKDYFTLNSGTSGVAIESKLLWQNCLTNLYIGDIINNNKCVLPTLEESFKIHKVMFKSIRKHFGVERVNIT